MGKLPRVLSRKIYSGARGAHTDGGASSVRMCIAYVFRRVAEVTRGQRTGRLAYPGGEPAGRWAHGVPGRAATWAMCCPAAPVELDDFHVARGAPGTNSSIQLSTSSTRTGYERPPYIRKNPQGYGDYTLMGGGVTGRGVN